MSNLFDKLSPGRIRERRVLSVDRIGELEAVVRVHRPRAWCSWSGRHRLEGQSRATVIRLSGDAAGPQASLIEQVHRVLDDIERIGAIASSEVARRSPGRSIEDFDLLSITDWEPNDDILQLDFAPLSPGILDDDVELEWPLDDVTRHRIRLRAACVAEPQGVTPAAFP